MHDGGCSTPLKCVNCTRHNIQEEVAHSALSSEYPIFKMEFEIQKIKTLQGIPYKLAKRTYESQPKPLFQRFADVAKTKSCGCSCKCQEKRTVPPHMLPVVKLQPLQSLPTQRSTREALKDFTPIPLSTPTATGVALPKEQSKATEKNVSNKTSEHDTEMISQESAFNGFNSQEVNSQTLADELKKIITEPFESPTKRWSDECDL